MPPSFPRHGKVRLSWRRYCSKADQYPKLGSKLFYRGAIEQRLEACVKTLYDAECVLDKEFNVLCASYLEVQYLTWQKPDHDAKAATGDA